ncbi:hypothetical protein NPIL_316881 [Nephila pilipes]|uniref:Uncharacterized protein n=1 Tax=Nephila pilipes TaxID=299642 RepID=A0A8X6PGS0_NEPPI|nr:hypothetical protein NPIL_316881 [Nephila pilipes]
MKTKKGCPPPTTPCLQAIRTLPCILIVGTTQQRKGNRGSGTVPWRLFQYVTFDKWVLPLLFSPRVDKMQQVASLSSKRWKIKVLVQCIPKLRSSYDESIS